jgi:predicted aspartyl protease
VGFSWGEVLPEIIGHVDARNRPLVTFSVPGHEDAVLALVDTGFNGYLLMHADVAKGLGFLVTDVTIPVEFAGYARREVNLAGGRITWFDQTIDVDVLVTTEERPRNVGSDEPIALIGAGLLNPHRLVVDFGSRRVSITQDD